MDQDEIDLIQGLCEDLENFINTKMSRVVRDHGANIALNVMTNVGTTVLAKALVMAHGEHRQLMGILFNIVDAKAQEGTAAINSLIAISKAMDGNIPDWPPKH